MADPGERKPIKSGPHAGGFAVFDGQAWRVEKSEQIEQHPETQGLREPRGAEETAGEGPGFRYYDAEPATVAGALRARGDEEGAVQVQREGRASPAYQAYADKAYADATALAEKHRVPVRRVTPGQEGWREMLAAGLGGLDSVVTGGVGRQVENPEWATKLAGQDRLLAFHREANAAGLVRSQADQIEELMGRHPIAAGAGALGSLAFGPRGMAGLLTKGASAAVPRLVPALAARPAARIAAEGALGGAAAAGAEVGVERAFEGKDAEIDPALAVGIGGLAGGALGAAAGGTRKAANAFTQHMRTTAANALPLTRLEQAGVEFGPLGGVKRVPGVDEAIRTVQDPSVPGLAGARRLSARDAAAKEGAEEIQRVGSKWDAETVDRMTARKAGALRLSQGPGSFGLGVEPVRTERAAATAQAVSDILTEQRMTPFVNNTRLAEEAVHMFRAVPARRRVADRAGLAFGPGMENAPEPEGALRTISAERARGLGFAVADDVETVHLVPNELTAAQLDNTVSALDDLATYSKDLPPFAKKKFERIAGAARQDMEAFPELRSARASNEREIGKLQATREGVGVRPDQAISADDIRQRAQIERSLANFGDEQPLVANVREMVASDPGARAKLEHILTLRDLQRLRNEAEPTAGVSMTARVLGNQQPLKLRAYPAARHIAGDRGYKQPTLSSIMGALQRPEEQR